MENAWITYQRVDEPWRCPAPGCGADTQKRACAHSGPTLQRLEDVRAYHPPVGESTIARAGRGVERPTWWLYHYLKPKRELR